MDVTQLCRKGKRLRARSVDDLDMYIDTVLENELQRDADLYDPD